MECFPDEQQRYVETISSSNERHESSRSGFDSTPISSAHKQNQISSAPSNSGARRQTTKFDEMNHFAGNFLVFVFVQDSSKREKTADRRSTRTIRNETFSSRFSFNFCFRFLLIDDFSSLIDSSVEPKHAATLWIVSTRKISSRLG